jgi:hypothetical protein
MPTLVLRGVSVSGSCSSGQPVEVDYTVANTGSDDADNVVVALSVSKDGAEVAGADQTVGAIPAGGDSGPLSWYFTPATPGSYVIYVSIYNGEHQTIVTECS